MQYVVFGWLAAIIIFLIIEIATINLTTIWFVGGALVALILNLLHAPVLAQGLTFFVVSVLLLIFVRPVLDRAIKKDNIKTNIDGVIGRTVKITETVNNLEETGAVMCEGKEWTARTEDNGVILEKDGTATVVAVSGVKLIIRGE